MDGAVTQDTMCKCGRVENNECKICVGPGTEKDRLYHCKEWNRMRLQLDTDVRLMEQIAESGSRCWLWGKVIFPFQERVRPRGLLIIRRRVEDGSVGCQKTRKRGTETLEATWENCY